MHWEKRGQGDVEQAFRARRRHIERLVAVKILTPGMAEYAEAVTRIRREVRAVPKLAPPNIVTASDPDPSDSSAIRVKIYVDGAGILRQRRRLSPEPAGFSAPAACSTPASRAGVPGA